MPFYTVEHSYPLVAEQKQQLAEAITHLHSSKFLTPSVFVHVNFKANNASESNYFIAGKPRITSTNRIMGVVRTSSSRTQEMWKELAQQIEEAWHDTVSGEKIEEGRDKGKRKGAVNDTESITEAKKMRLVAFQALVAIWENSGDIPPAGEEAAWLKTHRESFQSKADAGDEICKELLEEVSSREDLKKAYGV